MTRTSTPRLLRYADKDESCSRQFRFPQGDIDAIIAFIYQQAEIVTVTESIVGGSVDPKDDMFLAAAVAGNADVIVSGDHHLLDLRVYRGTTIVSLRDFLVRLPDIDVSKHGDR